MPCSPNTLSAGLRRPCSTSVKMPTDVNGLADVGYAKQVGGSDPRFEQRVHHPEVFGVNNLTVLGDGDGKAWDFESRHIDVGNVRYQIALMGLNHCLRGLRSAPPPRAPHHTSETVGRNPTHSP